MDKDLKRQNCAQTGKKERFAIAAGYPSVWQKHTAHLARILLISNLCATKTKVKIFKVQVQDLKDQFENSAYTQTRNFSSKYYFEVDKVQEEYNLKNLMQHVHQQLQYLLIKCLYFFLISPLSFRPQEVAFS